MFGRGGELFTDPERARDCLLIGFSTEGFGGVSEVFAGVGKVGVDLQRALERSDGFVVASGAVEGDSPVAKEGGVLGESMGQIAV